MASYNLTQQLYISDAGTVHPITTLMNADGEPAADGDEVKAFVVKLSEREWLTVLVESDDVPVECLG